MPLASADVPRRLGMALASAAIGNPSARIKRLALPSRGVVGDPQGKKG